MKFYLNDRWFMFLIFIVFMPLSFSNCFVQNYIYGLLDLCQAVIIIFLLLYYKKIKIKIDFFIITYIIYMLTYLFPAIVNHTITINSFILWLRIALLSTSFLFILQQSFKKDYIKTMKTLYFVFSFLCMLHIIMFYIFHIGVLGIRTRYTDYALPGLIFLGILLFSKNKKICIWDCLFIISGVIFTVNQGVSTGLFVIALFIFIVVSFRISFLRKIICNVTNYFFLCISTLIMNFLIVVMRIQNVFSFLIVNILHEEITFNGRTLIWDCVFEQMKYHNVFIGYGIKNYGNKDIKMTAQNQYGDYLLTDRQAHNQFLSVLYFNGIIGLLSYILLMILPAFNVSKIKNKGVKAFFSMGIFLYGLSMLTELSGDENMFLVFLSSAYYIYNWKDDLNC